MISKAFFSFFRAPAPLKFDPGFPFGLIDIFIFFTEHGCQPQPGGSDFDFVMCSPTDIGQRVTNPPYTLVVGHFVAPLLRPVWVC
jgi:hypothetical protein